MKSKSSRRPDRSRELQDELGLPTRFVGTGEKLEDLAPFDGRDFVANMI